ncbi:response regulator transcription factor [Shouchella clausii]|jgi:two-component system, response regulator YesN|uniref:DNA-binding response regulator n=1 Tax=Shouchella clausii TaxID=79880 RepID=A0A268RXF4_SHOCL|nr:response regulator [Shouchella clausii]PAD41362.1 hypothetical protein CHH54_17850 [Bacillus sp. 7520-S]AST97996.1 hypothetical protein BC8716_19415 [Shouchella clausii]MCR1289832.1 response regulator [Shouchella clausii]MEB5475093.1 response regulator [Shouchella clausii]PAE92814.1 hypothetical protein CHH71_19290 [Shouchella clausii]
MSIRMLIVDDEPVICQGLVQTIPWESLGVEVVDTAFNGKQALQKLEQQPVDLILTDISMPEMDGLALAEYIVHEKPETKMIIISGYDKFDYARQALRLGIEDYLLKPVDVDELMELVKQVTQKIVDDKKLKSSQAHDWIRHVLFHIPLSEQIDVKQTQSCGMFRLLISEVSGYAHLFKAVPTEESKQIQDKVRHVVEKTCEAYGVKQISLIGYENELLTVVFSDHSDMLSDFWLHEVWEEVLKQSPYPIQTVASSIGESLSTSYQQALRLLDDLRGHGIGLYTKGIECDQEAFDLDKTEHRLLETVLQHDESKLAECIRHVVSELMAKGYSLRYIVEVCQGLEIRIKQALQKRLPNRSFDSIELRLHGKLDLRYYNTSSAIEELFLRDLVDFLGELKEDEQNNWMIEKIKHYIHKHYQQDLRAAEVAERHFITPNYFSMLFKKETGQSFSEYVNRLRIEKSAELLLTTSNKVFEIAEYVGYKEYKYFVQVFKKQVGLTPTQYRRLNVTRDRREKQIES